MSKILAHFNDFTKGEAGWLDKTRLAAGFFTGENVMLYRDGTVGPRSGLVDLAPTGVALTSVLDLGYCNPGTTDEFVWVRDGTALRRVRVYQDGAGYVSAQAWTTDATAFALALAGDHVNYEKQITLVTIQTDKCYKLNWGAGAGAWNSAIAGSPGGGCIEIFGDQVVVGNVSGHPNRLVFSAQANYTSWPAANFLDVGNAGNAGANGAPRITALRKIKDQLLVFADTGQIWVITGLLGSKSTTVREFAPLDAMGVEVSEPQCVVRDRAGGLWWTRRHERPAPDQAWDRPSCVPVTFAAGVRGEVPNLGGYLRQPAFAVSNTTAQNNHGMTPRTDKSVLLADMGNGGLMRALLNRDSVWTRHKVNLGNGVLASCSGSRGEMFLAYFDATAAVRLGVWQVEYEQPPAPFVSGSSKLPLNVSDVSNVIQPLGAWFATPEYRDPGFQAVDIEGIEVLFSSWQGDGVTKNHADVYLQQYDASNVVEDVRSADIPPDFDLTGGNFTPPYGATIPLSQPIDELGPVAGGADRWRRRVRLYPVSGQAKPTASFRVLFKNLLNVSIEEVVVFGQVTAPDRR